MLSLTKKCDYALVALSHLARGTERLSSAREIADVYRVPLPILMNILKTLARQGMISSIRGAHGGYRLNMAPHDISLHMIVEAIEGPVSLFQCARPVDDEGNAGCKRQGFCPITAPARKVSHRLEEFLRGVTLAQIADDQAAFRPVAMGL